MACLISAGDSSSKGANRKLCRDSGERDETDVRGSFALGVLRFAPQCGQLTIGMLVGMLEGFPEFSSFFPAKCFVNVQRHTRTGRVHDAKAILGFCVSLVCRFS